MDKVLHIKNMVCPRCIQAVRRTLEELSVDVKEVTLGEVAVYNDLSADQRSELEHRLKDQGFELLEQGRSSLVSRIKSLIIEKIHHSDGEMTENFSSYLSDKLNHDYSYLSRLFSSVEGITIERFITWQRIEKAKELLFYDELSLKEIAYRLNYSSAAYLSTQFKKEIGMTPGAFKKLHHPGHKPLDSI